MFRVLGIAVIIAVIIGMALELKKPVAVNDEVEEFAPVKTVKKFFRKPASVVKKENKYVAAPTLGPRISERPSNGSESAIPDAAVESAATSGGGYAPVAEMGSSFPSSSPSRSPSSSSGSSGKKSDSGSTQTQTSGGTHTISIPGSSTSTSSNSNNTTTTTDTSSSGGSNSSSNNDTISCSSNVGGGAYNHPISVALSCTSSATISYCLSQGSCCDPESSGTTYSSQVPVGAEEGSYCLSFIGEGSNGNSEVINVNYTISHSLPHLNVDHKRTTYQTTELAGMSFLTSNDFSKTGYSIGQINLKSHDPGPSGLNLNCAEIMDEYSSFTSPLVSMTLTLYSMLGILPSQQIEVPLNLNQLEYGSNYITTYVVNQVYSSPMYSCSTTNVVLNDFEFYQTDSFHREIGGSGQQEFTGGFQSYGVFSPDEGMRAPASVSGEADLEVGMVEIFY